MSVLSPAQVRETINGIADNPEVKKHCWQMKGKFQPTDIQRAFETLIALGLRIGELCAESYPSDKNKNTGHTLQATEATYQPNRRLKEEIRNLTEIKFDENLDQGIERMPTRKEILDIREPIVFFDVQVEKRKDLYRRHTALPLNPEYEPLTQRIYDYFKQRQEENEPIFPINRMQMLRLAKKIFKGCQYQIVSYRREERVDGEPVYVDTGKFYPNGTKILEKQRVTVVYHTKPFGDHAIRHARVSELKALGIHGSVLKAFTGWTQTNDETLEETYAAETYRAYLPFLLSKTL